MQVSMVLSWFPAIAGNCSWKQLKSINMDVVKKPRQSINYQNNNT
jgi:hypothetical protein